MGDSYDNSTVHSGGWPMGDPWATHGEQKNPSATHSMTSTNSRWVVHGWPMGDPWASAIADYGLALSSDDP